MSAASSSASLLLGLHEGSGFVIPNAWDAGSARILEQVGFRAIATTSAGIAWSLGVPDGGDLDRDTMLEHIARIAGAVRVPVSADLEAGYGDTAEQVGVTVLRVIELGVAGANIEDAVHGALLGVEEAVDRIAAARAAAPAGTFVLNARTDAYFAGSAGDPFRETVDRALRYLDAGADCIFVPGVVEAAEIRRLAQSIPGPLNIVAGLANTIDAHTLFSLGVRRVSLGGSLARAAFGLLERAGRELIDEGRSTSSTMRSRTPISSDDSQGDVIGAQANPPEGARVARPATQGRADRVSGGWVPAARAAKRRNRSLPARTPVAQRAGSRRALL